MKMANLRLVLICFCITLVSCQNETKTLTYLTDPEFKNFDKTAEVLKKYLESYTDISLELKTGYLQEENTQLINDNLIDLAVVANDVYTDPNHSNIRTLLTLPPDIFLILYDKSIKHQNSILELLQGKLIGVESMEKDDSLFYENLLSAYGTRLDSLDLVVIDEDITTSEIEELDVLMISASLDNTRVIDLLKDRMRPLSLDDPELFQRGSLMEGFQMTYPKAYPFILPKGAFQGLVKEPILTVAIIDLLICHKDLEFETAYDIVKTTIERKNSMSQEDFEFGQISIRYDMTNLSFPLHEATLSYINRDQPSIFERYAELFGVVFSILVVLLGAISSIKRRYSQISKERIDVYYRKVLDVRDEAISNPSLRKETIDKLYKLRNASYEALINEKVKPDESFTILLSLIDETILEFTRETKSVIE